MTAPFHSSFCSPWCIWLRFCLHLRFRLHLWFPLYLGLRLIISRAGFISMCITRFLYIYTFKLALLIHDVMRRVIRVHVIRDHDFRCTLAPFSLVISQFALRFQFCSPITTLLSDYSFALRLQFCSWLWWWCWRPADHQLATN